MNTISLIRNIITIIATIIASYVALAGLDAWKKQLHGKTDYELARRYLRAVYKLRNAVKSVRNPFIPSDEIFAALQKSGLPSKDYSDHQKSTRAVYSSRWEKIVEAGTDLDTELLEAEISWGKEAIVVEEDLEKCMNELFVTLKMFLDGDPLDKKQKDIIYDKNFGQNDMTDEFGKKLKEATQKIEEYLKKYLV